MKSVLVVDDDASMRELLTGLLRDQYAVSQPRDGSEALQLVDRGVPDAILLDITMPVMDGRTFVKLSESAPVCGAACAGSIGRADRERGQSVGRRARVPVQTVGRGCPARRGGARDHSKRNARDTRRAGVRVRDSL